VELAYQPKEAAPLMVSLNPPRSLPFSWTTHIISADADVIDVSPLLWKKPIPYLKMQYYRMSCMLEAMGALSKLGTSQSYPSVISVS
jgi:hypothetical protein